MIRSLLVLVMLGVLTACSDSRPQPVEPTPPRPAVAGWLHVQLTSPHMNDGAVMFTLGGGPIDSVHTDSYALFVSGDGTARRVILHGNITAGLIARIWVPDTALAGSLSGALLQAVNRTTFAQQALDGYGLRIVR